MTFLARGRSGLQIGPAIKVLEEAAFRPAGFADRFTEVARLLDARTFHMTYDSGSGAPDLIIASENVPFLEAYIKGQWNDQDIWTETCRKLRYKGGLDLFSDSLIIDAASRRKSAFFNEFYPDWDVAHVACWCFRAGGDDLGFTIKRPRGRPFSETDMSELGVLKKAANRAALLVTVFHQQHVLGFLQGLEASKRPSIALNSHGEVVYVTASAEKLIGDGFAICRGIPFGMTPRSEAGFLALRQWARCRSGDLPESFVIDRLSDQRAIAAVPIAIPDDGLLALPFARVVVMLLDVSKRPDVPGPLLRSMFGLTNREADVAALLGRGGNVDDISDSLRLKPSSIRQVIKSVMAKAGVSRQSELVALLARLS